MAWSYGGVPGESNVDAVRFHSGQLSSGDPYLVYDEEIEYLLSQEGDVYGAAACVAENLANRYSGKAKSKTVGETTITYGEREKNYRDTARSLRSRSSLRGVQPYAGGISASDKAAVAGNTDRVTPAFAVGMDDAGGALTASSS
jgi:hypothetical protein